MCLLLLWKSLYLTHCAFLKPLVMIEERQFPLLNLLNLKVIVSKALRIHQLENMIEHVTTKLHSYLLVLLQAFGNRVVCYNKSGQVLINNKSLFLDICSCTKHCTRVTPAVSVCLYQPLITNKTSLSLSLPSSLSSLPPLFQGIVAPLLQP